MKAYSLIIVLMVVVLSYFLIQRKDVDITLLRAGGMLYQEQPGGYVSNLYTAELINKTAYPIKIDIVPDHKEAKINWIQPVNKIEKESTVKVTFFVLLPAKSIKQSKTNITLLVKQNGKVINQMKTNFLGPVN
jgi:hypothetical protein